MGGNTLPAITGNQLIKLLEKDGWENAGYAKGGHTIKFRKHIDGRTLVTMIQPINRPLKDGTLSAILGSKQTKIGKEGLRKLLENNEKTAG